MAKTVPGGGGGGDGGGGDGGGGGAPTPGGVPAPGGDGGGSTNITITGGGVSGGSSAGGGFDRDEALENQFRQAYFQLWGVYPTDSYVQHAVNSGMNIYEFIDEERHKPAYLRSEPAKKKAEGYAAVLHQIGAVG